MKIIQQSNSNIKFNFSNSHDVEVYVSNQQCCSDNSVEAVKILETTKIVNLKFPEMRIFFRRNFDLVAKWKTSLVT